MDIAASWCEVRHTRRHIGSLWRRMKGGGTKKPTREFETRTKWRGGHKSYVSSDVVCKIFPNCLLPLDWGWRHIVPYMLYCEYIYMYKSKCGGWAERERGGGRSRYGEAGLAVGYLRSWQLLRMSRNSPYHPLSTHPSRHLSFTSWNLPSPLSHLISFFFFTYWLGNKRRGYNIFFDVMRNANIVAVFKCVAEIFRLYAQKWRHYDIEKCSFSRRHSFTYALLASLNMKRNVQNSFISVRK